MKPSTPMLSLLASVISLSLFAEEPVQKKPVRLPNPARIRELQMERFGGMIKDIRQQKGRIVIVNAQESAPVAWLKKPVDEVAVLTRITIDVEKGAFDFAAPKVVGEATLFVIEDAKLPISLVAPESRWAMVNVARLKNDKQSFFEGRVKKALARTLAYLMGAADSRSPTSVMGCITSAEGYDQIVSAKLPVDVTSKFPRYVENYGVTQYNMARYEKAVQEGWAPAPTNDAQKAVWNRVHEIPSKPLKIEFDPKTDKK